MESNLPWHVVDGDKTGVAGVVVTDTRVNAAGFRSFFERVASTPGRPDQASPDHMMTRYVGSYLLLRLAIGVIGVILPFALYVGGSFLDHSWKPRGSLSAYYHSGARDLFVGCLCSVGLFLLTYMIFHRNWDNLFSIIAGVAAGGVALFPTGGGTRLTALQEQFGEGHVKLVHFLCTGFFIGSLALISVAFGWREGRREDRTPAEHRKWRRFHYACAGLIVLAVLYIILTKVSHVGDDYSLLVGEVVAVLAFGVSWLVKGAEWDVLRAAVRGPSPTASTTGPA